MKNSSQFKVIGFSFAGGSQYSFHALKKHLPIYIDFITTDYPGRGARMHEPLLKDLNSITTDMYHQIKEKINAPYFLYGHSMGGLVAYKLALLIRLKGARMPEGVFITGCQAPSAWNNKKNLHDLPYPEFITELKKMNGIPDKILEDEDTMRFFEPILRADFSVVASHVYQPHEPLPVAFKVITGTHEDISVEEGMKWQQETTVPLRFKRFEGGHFFIFDQPEKIAGEIEEWHQEWKQNNSLHFTS